MVKYFLRLLLGSVLLVLCASVYSEDSGFYVSVQAGHSWVKIQEDYLLPDFDESVTMTGAYANAGYQFGNIVIEAGGGYGENLSALGSSYDNFELSELKTSIGFLIPLSQKFRLVPKVGRYRWRLKADEGQYLNPGPEDQAATHATEGHWQIDGEIKFNNWLAMDISYFFSDTDFGKVNSYRVGVQFNF